MSKIVSIHSFRGGTGKSNTTANLSALLAMEGRRVGVIDTDIQSPGIHVLFGVDENEVAHTLNDFLWGKCNIEDAAVDVTACLGVEVKGRIFLIPSSIKTGEIARVLKESYDVGLLNDGLYALVEKLELDVLMIDTHPGLNEETLLSLILSDVLFIIMRPDQQDFQGTAVTVDVARQLDVPNMMLIVNKVPKVLGLDSVKAHVEQVYGCEVAAVLPHSDEMMALASEGIFVLRYPDHPVTAAYKQAVAKLID